MNSFTVLNGAAYFWADDGTNGVELWRSDGTTAGTAIVANIGPGAIGFGGVITFSRAIAAHGGVLYFMAEDAQSGPELWRSDGTREGTYRLADINPGAAGSEPTDFTTAGAHLFFVANDGVHGRELWRTDGTVSGTRLVADISPGSTDGVAGLFGVAVAGNALYFGASDGTHGLEPWRATADSASMIVDLQRASGSRQSQQERRFESARLPARRRSRRVHRPRVHAGDVRHSAVPGYRRPLARGGDGHAAIRQSVRAGARFESHAVPLRSVGRGCQRAVGDGRFCRGHRATASRRRAAVCVGHFAGARAHRHRGILLCQHDKPA